MFYNQNFSVYLLIKFSLKDYQPDTFLGYTKALNSLADPLVVSGSNKDLMCTFLLHLNVQINQSFFVFCFLFSKYIS